ncbi:MAG: AMP-binding protein [Kouleothrix sp.]|nr:AMP-binding protein [Kouleothrix sp.]
MPGLELTPLPLTQTTAKFDLTLFVAEQAGALVGSVEYATDLFAPPTIARLIGHFEVLLTTALAQPDQPYPALPLLTPAERHQLLHAWNATQVAHPPRQLVTTLVEAQADAGGARLAVADGHTALSYQALDQRANQLAHVLQQRGVGPDVPVVLALPRTTTQVVAALAVLKAGGAYLPLDPSWPAERLAQIVREARPALVLTDTTLAHVCATQAAPVLVLDAVWDELVAPAPCHRPAAPVLPEHLAYVIYTSGSTGQPKGIAVTHASLHNLIHWYQRTYQLRGHDRVAHVVGQAFDVAVSDLWTTLASGASLHLPDEGQRRDPQQLVAWLAAQAITVAFVATPLAELVLQRASPDGLVLRVLLTGGGQAAARAAGRAPLPPGGQLRPG